MHLPHLSSLCVGAGVGAVSVAQAGPQPGHRLHAGHSGQECNGGRRQHHGTHSRILGNRTLRVRLGLGLGAVGLGSSCLLA